MTAASVLVVATIRPTDAQAVETIEAAANTLAQTEDVSSILGVDVEEIGAPAIVVVTLPAPSPPPAPPAHLAPPVSVSPSTPFPPSPSRPPVALVEASANVEDDGDLDGGGTAAVVVGAVGAGVAAVAIAWLVRRKRNRARLMLTRRSSDPGTEVTSATAPTAPADVDIKADVDVKVVVDATRRFSMSEQI